MKTMIKNSPARYLGMVGAFMLLLPAGGALAVGVAGTKHDLSGATGNTGASNTDAGTTETCVYCHTPHQSITNDTIPLWNQQLSTESSYGVYASNTMDGSPTEVGNGGDEATATVSNLCLSCHDGTVAIGSLTNPSNIEGAPTIGGDSIDTDETLLSTVTTNLGADLSDDHPINFSYDTSLTNDDGLADASTVTTAGLELFGTDNEVQCASCHNPHDDTNGMFLRASMDSSGLCTTCHNNK